MTFKREMDFDDLDASQNGVNRRQDHPSVSYNKQTADDQVPSGWTKPKDLCSLNDWLNSNSKNPDVEQDKLDKLEDQWIHDRQGKQKNTLDSSDFDKTANAKADARLNVRNQRDETKKAGAPSLESLKETILELKKSLNEADVKQREDSKSVDTAKVGEEGSIKRNQKERRTHARSKHRKTEDDAEAISGWTGDPDTGTLDLRKRERVSEDPSERNARLKVWRTKRTEVNNDDSNRKLFHRAGFGAPYLEEDVLKELHDRKRRSKGTPSDEKHRLKEDKNNSGDDEKNSIRISKAAGCSDADASGKRGSPSNDPLETSKPTNDPVDTGSSVDALKERKGGVGNADETRNYEQSDLSRENSNAMGNELTKNEEKGESPQGNSLRTFEPVTNELRPVSRSEISRLSADARERAEEAGMQKTEENQENADSTKGEQVIKVFKPQERPYQNSERAKEVRGAEPDEDRGKLSQRPAEGRGPSKESGNINILLASENKNLLKFSNTGGGGGDESLKGEQPPFVLNAFDVKKKLFVENEDAPGKSVSTVFNVKIEKAQVDTPVKTIGERERNRKSDDAQFRGGAPDFGENKGNGVPYGDTPGSANNLKERNADEKRLTNSIESDKGAEQSGVNENGIRNWFEGAVPDQVGASVDRIAPEKCDDRNERDKFKNEGERLNDCNEKTDFAHGFNDKVESNDANDGRKDKKKYREIFIMNNGMDDRVMNDGLGKRKILQYMEYSNDDIEDVDQPYGDKEEEDSQQEIGAEKSDAPAIRKERSAYADKKKAKVNLLIKEKLKKKKGGRRGRKRRNPSVIEYYDYDSDSEQRDHEAMSPTSEQERTKNNYPDKNAIESDAGLGNHECNSPSSKI
ncbi:unnamed protein product [Xylocopa violacea]|uniref:Uncharacterized protein n=1 Tax=Xylocopa violacea TaxID=135666 RepID=A0ABP1PHG9_XYLVO